MSELVKRADGDGSGDPAGPVPPGDPGGDSPRRPVWRRPPWLTRKRALLAALIAAAVLLWPFTGYSPWPLLGGLATLVLLSLLRLRDKLGNWTPILVASVVAVWMATLTSPWVWGIAAGVTLAVTGMVRWPRKDMLVAGLVIGLVSGAGYGWDRHEDKVAARKTFQQQSEVRISQGLPEYPTEVPAALARRLGEGNSDLACRLFSPDAQRQFSAALGFADCSPAVHSWSTKVPDRNLYRSPKVSYDAVIRGSGSVVINACTMSWDVADGAPDPGPQIGLLTVERHLGNGYWVTGYQPCPRTGTRSEAGSR